MSALLLIAAALTATGCLCGVATQKDPGTRVFAVAVNAYLTAVMIVAAMML